LHHFYYRVTVKFAQPRKLVGAVKLLLTNLTVKQRLYHSNFGSNVRQFSRPYGTRIAVARLPSDKSLG
jgi:hypothetical protein